jgi:membrane-associated phospholipid phosphatase
MATVRRVRPVASVRMATTEDAPEQLQPKLLHPLLPGPAQRAAIVWLAVCAVVTVALAVRYGGQSHAGRLDGSVGGWVQDLVGAHTGVLSLAVHVGDPETVVLGACLLLLACVVLHRWRGAVLVAVAVPSATALTKILQPLIHRTLNGGASFPSGHATGAFVLAAVFAVLLVNPPTPRLPAMVRVIVALAALAGGGVVAVALVRLDFHYATDTLGGAAVATGVVVAVALAVDRLVERQGSRYVGW